MIRILVIDDDQEILHLIREGFSRDKSFEVLCVSNGHDALDMMNLYRFDLFLIDIEMPQFNGYKLATRITRSWKNKLTPIVFISGKSEKRDVDKAIRLGAIEYLIKPFSIFDIKSRVKKCLESHPSIKRSQITFSDTPENWAELNLVNRIRVLKMNELGVSFECQDKIGETNTKIDLKWSLFSQLGYPKVRVEIINIEYTEDKYIYEVQFYKPSFEFIELLRTQLLSSYLNNQILLPHISGQSN